MKKILLTLAVALLCFGLVACGNKVETETIDDLSYEYSSNAVRVEDADYITYCYGGTDIDSAEYLIQISYEDFDAEYKSLWKDSHDKVSWIIKNMEEDPEIYKDFKQEDSFLIDGNSAKTYSYKFMDYTGAHKKVLLARGDKVLEITAYFVDRDDCESELTRIIESMKFED